MAARTTLPYNNPGKLKTTPFEALEHPPYKALVAAILNRGVVDGTPYQVRRHHYVVIELTAAVQANAILLDQARHQGLPTETLLAWSKAPLTVARTALDGMHSLGILDRGDDGTWRSYRTQAAIRAAREAVAAAPAPNPDARADMVRALVNHGYEPATASALVSEWLRSTGMARPRRPDAANRNRNSVAGVALSGYLPRQDRTP